MKNLKKAGWVPWYRKKDYDGNLTETQKRELDGFRLGEKHPAASYDSLPDEVQNYINRIELELYDKKQDQALSLALFLTAIGGFLIYLGYSDQSWSPVFSYVIGTVAVVFAWVRYRQEWNKNARENFPNFEMESAPNQSDQGIQFEWELNYIVQKKRSSDLQDFD